MSMIHMIILAIVAVIVIPPDKLPEFARQAARFFNDLRRTTSGFWDDVKKDAMVTPDDLAQQRKIIPKPDLVAEDAIVIPPVETKKHDT